MNPITTDRRKLKKAFAELDAQGILARMNYWCCQGCGISALTTEIKDERKTGRKIKGYVFFHEQDADSANETGILWLAYGSASGNEKTTIAVAKAVVKALEAAGLEVKWEGYPNVRICVTGVWRQKRFKTRKESLLQRMARYFW